MDSAADPKTPTPIGCGESPGTLPFPATPSPVIQLCQQAFRRDLTRLLKEHKGEWVAYHGDVPVGFGASKRVLYQECLRRGLNAWEFIVRRIEPEVPREIDSLPEV